MKRSPSTRPAARQASERTPEKAPAASSTDTSRPASNRSLQRMVGRLQLGSGRDPLEADADRAATGALARPAGEASAAQRPRRASSPTLTDGAAPDSVARTLSHPGVPLDAQVQQEMSGSFGHDFSAVRVHTGALAAQSARELVAPAYTAGQHVVFGAGAYAPRTPAGRSLLAHELAHTMQQSSPWVQRAPPPTRPNASEPAVLDAMKETLDRKGLLFSTEVEVEVSNIKGVKGSVTLRFDVVYEADRLYLVEAKGAKPESLTPPQRKAHRALQEHGGTAVVTGVGAKPPGAARVRGIPTLTPGHTWQVKPGDLQHVHGRFTTSVKPQALSQPNTMVVTAWQEGMEGQYPDAVPRKPDEMRVVKPNQPPKFLPQDERLNPDVTPQLRKKAAIPQKFMYPKKPPAGPRPGNFDEDEPTPQGMRKKDPDRGPGGTKPFYRKQERTKPIVAQAPEIDPPADVLTTPPKGVLKPKGGLKIDSDSAFRPGQGPMKVPKVKLSGFRAGAKGLAGAAVVLLAALGAQELTNQAVQSTIEKKTRSALSDLQPELDAMLEQSPKEIHAVVKVTIQIHIVPNPDTEGPREIRGIPHVDVSVSLATAGIASSQSDDISPNSLLGVRTEKTELAYSFLVLDVEKELARQEVARKDALLNDQLNEIKAREDEKEHNNPTPKQPASKPPETRYPGPLAPSHKQPSAQEQPSSLVPGWPSMDGPHEEEERRSKESWQSGQWLLGRGRELIDTNERDAGQVKEFYELVLAYRGLVQKMLREFTHPRSRERLQKLLPAFDERMKKRFKKLGLPYPQDA